MIHKFLSISNRDSKMVRVVADLLEELLGLLERR